MHRRDLLKSLASGAGLVASQTAPLPAQRATPTGAKDAAPDKRFIETRDGASLFYKDWGAGRPVVFVAPWALNSDWWEYQMTYLAGQGLRCIAYDRRGHGRSGWPRQGYEFNTLADDLAAVIEQLNLHGVTLVGHSMGCGEVVRYLSRHRARRVVRAVLVATITPFTLKTADNPDGVERSVLEKGRIALSQDRPHQIAKAAPAFFGAPKNPVSTEIMEWWTRMIIDQCSLKTMLDLHRVFTETDFRPELRTIKVPTLIIHGDSDTSTPIDFTGRRTERLIPSGQLKVYEGAAHGLPITHMDQLNADLLAFVKG
jgi:pimeloyl-ACP methyl ester carboxylesterase